jgi:hypothetical protein
LYHILDHKTGYYENAKNVKKNVSIQPDDKSSQIITEKCEEHYYHPDNKKPYAENPVSFTKMITSMLLSSQMITSGLLSIPRVTTILSSQMVTSRLLSSQMVTLRLLSSLMVTLRLLFSLMVT